MELLLTLKSLSSRLPNVSCGIPGLPPPLSPVRRLKEGKTSKERSLCQICPPSPGAHGAVDGLPSPWGGYPLLLHCHGNGQWCETQWAPQRNLENSSNVNFLCFCTLYFAHNLMHQHLVLNFKYDRRQKGRASKFTLTCS